MDMARILQRDDRQGQTMDELRILAGRLALVGYRDESEEVWVENEAQVWE